MRMWYVARVQYEQGAVLVREILPSCGDGREWEGMVVDTQVILAYAQRDIWKISEVMGWKVSSIIKDFENP